MRVVLLLHLPVLMQPPPPPQPEVKPVRDHVDGGSYPLRCKRVFVQILQTGWHNVSYSFADDGEEHE